MDTVQVLPAVNSGFSQSCIDKMNNYLTSRVILIDSTFYKEYLKLLENLSINDAKQLIHIYKRWNNQPLNFYYQSEDDILINLTTIVSSLQNPTYQLQELFKAKIQFLLPTDLHKWIENDLSAMLFFVAIISNSLTNKAFLGGEEFKSYFMNFIQFNVIQHIDGITKYTPIEFTNSFDLQYWMNEYEEYKRWYLSEITPESSYKWLKKCEDEQLDSLIANLSEKELLILKGIFYPQTKEDKIALLIASLNAISKMPKIECKKLSYDIMHPVTFRETTRAYARWYKGYLIFEEGLFDIEFDKDEYEGIGILANQCDFNLVPFDGYSNLRWNAGKYENSVIVGKYQDEVVLKERQYFINQLKNTARKKKARAIETISKEERTVSIMKKNMPKLEELAQSQNMTLNQLTNKLIEVEYESKNPD